MFDTRLATTIGTDEFHISTTEHLMAALNAFGIDNADIEVDSHEVPIMDGSAEPFFTLLTQSGRKRQEKTRRVLKITKPITYQEEDKLLTITPYNGFKVTEEICFDAEIIKTQKFSFDSANNDFMELARARTFGYVEEVEHLWDNGLALGGNLSNVIAIHWNRKTILNEDGLRYEDEFVRHKVLDLIGDIALLGIPVLGHIQAYKAGHAQHLGLMKAIEAAEDSWEVVELQHNGGYSVLNDKRDNSTGNTVLPFYTPSAVPAALAA